METIVILGAGFGGIIYAGKLLRAGFNVILLEKSDTLGGVWNHIANQWSMVQINEPSYRFDLDYDGHYPEDYTPKSQILEQAAAYCKKYDIHKKIRFHAEAKKITKNSNGSYTVHYNDNEQITADGVIISTGRLQSVKKIPYKNEETFKGKINFGVSDLCSCDLSGKNVVIVGMGAFAVENARHAVNSGCASVTIVARTHSLVVPRMVPYKISSNIRYQGKPFVDLLKKAYTIINREDLLDLNGVKFQPNQNVPGVSDFFFLGIFYNKIKVIKSEIQEFKQDAAVLANGQTVPCEVVIKCAGFQQNEILEHLARMTGVAIPQKGLYCNGTPDLFYAFEPTVGDLNILTAGVAIHSAVALYDLLSDVYLYFIKNRSSFNKIENFIPQFKNYLYTSLEIMEFLGVLAAYDDNIKNIIKFHLIKKVYLCLSRYTEQQFININKKDWMDWCKKLAPDQKPLPYPFKANTSFFRKYLYQALYFYYKIKIDRLLFGRNSLADS